MANTSTIARPERVPAAMQDPISEAISILTADAASIRESHTPLCDRDDWSSEPETKAYYDRLLHVAGELSKLRAPAADERAALAEFLDAASAIIPTESEAYTFLADDGERSTVSHIINLKCRAKDWCGFKQAYDKARAALASAPVAGEAVPDGYVMLPAKETEAMHDAIMEHLYLGVSRTETQKLLDAYIKAAGASVMVDMTPPATARDRWMYEQGRLAERDPRTYAAPQASEPVRDAVQFVLKNFKASEDQGFRSRDRQFAISILEEALSAQPGAQKDRDQ